MSRVKDALDLLAERKEAAFAIDPSDRIVLWNAACERLLGFAAREVLGKYCYDALAGRDPQGNISCHLHCAAVQEARDIDKPATKSFALVAKDSKGTERRLSVSTLLVPAVRLSLSTVVHVLREDAAVPVGFVEELHESAAATAKKTVPRRKPDEEPGADLTLREREIVRCLAEGLGTADIARRLSIAEVTVRNHTQSVLQKLDVHSKLAAVVYAFRHKLI